MCSKDFASLGPSKTERLRINENLYRDFRDQLSHEKENNFGTRFHTLNDRDFTPKRPYERCHTYENSSSVSPGYTSHEIRSVNLGKENCQEDVTSST